MVFGCSDGVLIFNEDDEVFISVFIDNIDGFGDLCIGIMYGYEYVEVFIGIVL